MTGEPYQHIRASEHHGVTLVEFNVDELVDEELIQETGDELLAVIEAPQCDKLVVSLGEVHMVSSAALGKMITVHRRMQRKDGRVLFCDISETVGDILHACRLDQFFSLAQDRDEAFAALA